MKNLFKIVMFTKKQRAENCMASPSPLWWDPRLEFSEWAGLLASTITSVNCFMSLNQVPHSSAETSYTRKSKLPFQILHFQGFRTTMLKKAEYAEVMWLLVALSPGGSDVGLS